MKNRRRNTPYFTFLAWASFSIFSVLTFIGLYHLEEPLYVKGYYLMGAIGIIVSSFMVAKVTRDNQEDMEDEQFEEVKKGKNEKIES
ncbi:YiaA/YiaB family inner membrane protein [Bacillus sp. AFS088145]|uniref:YiaA/YiaB family inner membrane protein n=1 Tax=Bacillus sp. AFS088145 TaxID=2033514 RepID=UPI000BF39354|nr:YiaA/YiaB family inner membrane protein [Bacillus sp. AFS088145]PFH90542.1 hypothetical protein COI44_03355 [Bacillus sp. AFS088145]